METASTLAVPADASPTPDSISLYYLELERLLDRLNRSRNHYQVLGLDRSAVQKDVRDAYQQALVLLHPPEEVRSTMAEHTLLRIESAFERVCTAYAVLSDFGERADYENSIFPRLNRRIPVSFPENSSPYAYANDSTQPCPSQTNTSQMTGNLPEASRDERRRSDRYSMCIPVRVTGFDRIEGMWSDLAETLDAGRHGVAIRMHRQLQFGRIVHLCLPLPDILRDFGQMEPEYTVYALVRRIEPAEGGQRTIGLEFIGGEAPSGFSETPWGVFKANPWRGGERRRAPRIDRAEVVSVEYLTEEMQHIRQEVGVTENVSAGGIRVYLKSAPQAISIVRVTNLDRTFESRGVVCNRYVGSDGFERLCIRFLDSHWPM